MRVFTNAITKHKLKTNLKDVGQQITKYRKKNHVTETELADRANLPQSSIARIEHGKNTSTLTLAKIALVMNRNVSLKTNHNPKVITNDMDNE